MGQLGLRSIISFHGQTVKQLRSEFTSAVDDYLADCAEQGISPEKPASGKLLLRVPPEIHSKALIRAQATGKSLNQWATEGKLLANDPSTRTHRSERMPQKNQWPLPRPFAFVRGLAPIRS